MLISVQFPIADARGLFGGTDRLGVPEWPAPVADFQPQFVRSFGRARRRRKEADAAWLEDDYYCDARGAIRFVGTPRQLPKLPQYRFRIAFRRFFSNGGCVSRVEIGIAFRSVIWPEAEPISASTLVALISEVIRLRTSIRPLRKSGARNAEQALITQGPALARRYARASSAQANPVTDASSSELVQAGRPLVVFHLPPFHGDLPPTFKRCAPIADRAIDTYFGWIHTEWGEVGAWLLSGSEGVASNSLRSLRLCLTRLHAEQEALDFVLRQVKRQSVPLDRDGVADRLDEFFNQATRLINRANWGNVKQSEIVAAFDAADSVRRPSDRSLLLERYEGARRQVWAKIEEYQLRRASARSVTYVTIETGGQYVENKGNIIHGGTFYGPVIGQQIAERIENNFSSFAQANPDAALKAAVRSLNDESKKLVEKIIEQGAADPVVSRELADGVAQHAKTITEQATEKAKGGKPMKSYLELSGKGMLDAAKTVASMVGPITTAVKGVMALLGYPMP